MTQSKGLMRRCGAWGLVLGLVCLLISEPVSCSVTVFLGPDGTDGDSCGQVGQEPCATLAYILAMQTPQQPNLTVVVLPGRYSGSGFANLSVTMGQLIIRPAPGSIGNITFDLLFAPATSFMAISGASTIVSLTSLQFTNSANGFLTVNQGAVLQSTQVVFKSSSGASAVIMSMSTGSFQVCSALLFLFFIFFFSFSFVLKQGFGIHELYE